MSEADSDLFEALSSLEAIARTGHADMGTYSYDYVNIDSVLAAVRPVLREHGIVVQQSVGGDPECRYVSVTTILRHRSGQTWQSEAAVFPRGNNAQTQGSIITYLRRYSLLAFLGLPTEDDDGARSARASAQRQAPPPRQASPPPQRTTTPPPARTPEEASIRALPTENGLNEADASAFWARFNEQFGRLRDLAPARHPEAWAWAQDEVEFFRAAADDS